MSSSKNFCFFLLYVSTGDTDDRFCQSFCLNGRPIHVFFQLSIHREEMGKTKKQVTKKDAVVENPDLMVKEKSGESRNATSRIIAGNTTACSPLILESAKIILLAYG